MSIGGPFNDRSQTYARANIDGKLGGSRFGSQAIGTTVVTLLAPGSNTNGVVLRTACIGGPGTIYLMAMTATPSGITDTAADVLIGAANGIIENLSPEGGFFLPSGYGIFAVASAAAHVCYATWDTLGTP